MLNIDVQENINYYKNLKPQLAGLLNFFSMTCNLQNQHIKQLSPGFIMSQETAIKKLQSGKYLMEEVLWPVDKQAFKKIVDGLIGVLKENNEKTEHIEKLFSGLPDYIPNKLSDLINLFTGDKKEMGAAERNTVNYILWQALRIFYLKESEQFKDMDYQPYWTKSICPVCGNLPKISRLLKDNGKRALACHLCRTEWVVPRISCAFCGNTSQDKLGYLYADDNKAYRADVCHKCNKYLKTIDERVLGREIILELEDVITYHLDTLAISGGYQNPLTFYNDDKH
jgi:FdhE protein